MSNRLKSGLFFGLAMTFIFLSKTIIAWVTGEEERTDEIVRSIVGAGMAGIVSGILMGWMTDRFFASNIFTKSTDFHFGNGEVAIFQTAANHFKGTEAVGGSLCLTNKRLLFKSHNLNVQNHDLSIPLADVEKLERFKTLGLVNNGLAIKLSTNVSEKFVVDKANQWLEHLKRAKNVV